MKVICAVWMPICDAGLGRPSLSVGDTLTVMEPVLVLADIHLGRKQKDDKKIGPGIEWALSALDRGAEARAGHMVMLGDVIDRKRFTGAHLRRGDAVL